MKEEQIWKYGFMTGFGITLVAEIIAVFLVKLLLI